MYEGKARKPAFRQFLRMALDYVTKYIEFWLRFIGVRSITAMTVEHTWDGRALNMIDQGKKRAAELARKF